MRTDYRVSRVTLVKITNLRTPDFFNFVTLFFTPKNTALLLNPTVKRMIEFIFISTLFSVLLLQNQISRSFIFFYFLTIKSLIYKNINTISCNCCSSFNRWYQVCSVSEQLSTYPSPKPTLNPNLLSVDCCWVKGGVGVQLLRY